MTSPSTVRFAFQALPIHSPLYCIVHIFLVDVMVTKNSEGAISLKLSATPVLYYKMDSMSPQQFVSLYPRRAIPETFNPKTTGAKVRMDVVKIGEGMEATDGPGKKGCGQGRRGGRERTKEQDMEGGKEGIEAWERWCKGGM